MLASTTTIVVFRIRNSPRTLKDWKDQWTREPIAEDWVPNLPNISIAVDAFSKTYYSLLLSDFNSSNEIMQTNALSTARGLEYLQTVNDVDLARAKEEFGGDGDGRIGRRFKVDSTNLTQPLEFAEYTTLFQRYVCSIPKPKSTFKLLFAVAVADIVLLSTSWKLFGWIATWWLGRKDPNLDHCIGCVNAARDIPLTSAPGSGGGSYNRVPSDAGDEHRGQERRLSAPQIARVHSGV